MAPAFRRGDENRPQRWILASSRVNGTAVPGSLFEGAAEAKLRLRECTPMVALGQRYTRWLLLALKFLSVYVHRRTLPQSRFARQLPQGGSRGAFPHNINHPPAGYFVSGRVIFAGSGWEGCFAIQPGACKTARFRAIFIAPTKCAIQPTAQKPQGFGRFSSPLRKCAI